MWQKTYRIRLEGSEAAPESVISIWKSSFSDFWPEGNDFYTSLTGIAPGEVAVINLSGPGGVSLSTGIIVIYADDVSFSFMNPEGHMFAGMITFSAYEDEGATEAQVQVLIRANDPLYEIGCRIGVVHKREDQFWHETLRALARHFGVEGEVQQLVTLVDPKIQWSNAGNLWQNAAIRSGLYMPIGWLKRLRS